jgi:hypothetical protein
MQSPNKTLLNHFPFSLELWLCHTALTWQEQENLGYKPRFLGLAQNTVDLRLLTF